ncbi:nitronate monooxygenase [Pseudomonas sp. P66]|uniref:Nitronate monooxygenase n=1 Tax=Pseudomonas arcuscaelestis TaxID=2710591 RepID=A0ABS2BSM7_9PSED|nr:nitronate monooxygenase [Pseudomonas arcuscaelestis]MBM3112337.1 nitronate monooxygenase [Pseudomonas arcuscaelestis]MBM5456455.1 nitronate monooxygenase [Pseudomonas arcuscaelestis]
MSYPSLQTPLAKSLGCRYPIICLAGPQVDQAEFAAAIGNAGGLGCIQTARVTSAQLQQQVFAYQALSQRPFAAILDCTCTARSLHNEQIQACLTLQVPIVILASTVQSSVIEQFKRAGVQVLQQVKQSRQAIHAMEAGADALIAQADRSSPNLAYELALLNNAPVIAAGGIRTGNAVVAALGRGAQGVLCQLTGYAIDNFQAREHYAGRLAQLVDEAKVCMALERGECDGRFKRSMEMAMAYRARKGAVAAQVGLGDGGIV